MNVSLYQAASALHAMDRWQETISENLASASVPGFKKQDVSFEAVQAGRHQLTTAPGTAANGAGAVWMQTGRNGTNFQPGEFRTTHVKTDLAIDGKAFFEVQLPNGSSAFTRDGEFQISSTGQLVTKDGFTVLGDSGPIQLDLNNYTQMSISSTGEVSQGTDLKGRIRLTEFSKPQALTRISGGYFMATSPEPGPAPAAGSTVRQGVLESANTSVVREMANLMVAMRTFEANQRMAQLHDDRMSRAINDLTATT